MYNRLIQSGVDFIFTHGNAGEENREIYCYGIELILMYLINAGTLLILGLLTGNFWETLLILVTFGLLQSFAGGYHAMTHFRCFFAMFCGWVIMILTIPKIVSLPFLSSGFSIIGFIVVFIFAPVKHVNFPMSIEKEQKMKRIARSIAFVFCFIICSCGFLFPNAAFVAVLGITMLFSAISILCAVLKENHNKKS